MTYKLSLLGLVVVAAVLSLLLVLHHFDAKQVPAAEPLQSLDLDTQGRIGGTDNVTPDDATSSCDANAPGMADPSAVYCDELGYEFQIVDGCQGQYGVCVFPDGSSCDEWRFLEGKCGQAYSYCARQGYDLITKTDGRDPFSREYAVCVHDHEEIGSVTELMRLSEKATRGSFRAEQNPPPPAEGPSTEPQAASAPSPSTGGTTTDRTG